MSKTFDELIALVKERAALEVDAWIPEKVGDNIAGEIIDLGSIDTIYGEYMTTTVLAEDKRHYRLCWMGAVLESQYSRMKPDMGDFVAMHYQKDVKPKSGMQQYKLINAAVFTADGKPKRPINLGVRVPTEADLENTTEDIVTGRPNTEQNWEPFPDEVTEDDDTEISVETSKKK